MRIKLFEEISNEVDGKKIVKKLNSILLEFFHSYDDEPIVRTCTVDLNDTVTPIPGDSDYDGYFDENGNPIMIKSYTFILSNDEFNDIEEILEKHQTEMHNKLLKIGYCGVSVFIVDDQFTEYNEDGNVAIFTFFDNKYRDVVKLDEADSSLDYEVSKRTMQKLI